MSLLIRWHRRQRAQTEPGLMPAWANHGKPHTAYAGSPSRSEYHVGSLVSTCSNPDCRSGWLHLWRDRSTPVFEGGWTCSTLCARAQVTAAIARELDGPAAASASHRHRLPLGLLLLEHGRISCDQLRRALDSQRAAGSGRLGEWLVRQKAVTEQDVTRALAIQWSCPVLSLEHFNPAACTVLMPRLFIDAFAALPLRVAAGKVLYLGFAQNLDPVLALAVERMTGLRVESGIVQESGWIPARARMLQSEFPPVTLIEAVSHEAAAQTLVQSLERAKPVESRLVRVHDCLWLRLWLRPQTGPAPAISSIRDILCSIGPI